MKFLKRKSVWLSLLAAILIFLFWPVDPVLKHRYGQVILARDSSFLRVFLNDQQQWLLSPTLKPGIPAKLKTAVLAFEDQHFYYHPGINPVSIARAIWLNSRNNRIVSGGSTITMQLARMSLDNPRTVKNKLLEMLLAIRFEVQLSKDQILTEYLSTAPYGSNIRGYLAASYKYFGKSPSNLTWAEAATLAVLPNAPGNIYPSKNTDLLTEKRDVLLRVLLEREIISNETYELSLLEQVPDEILPFPFYAPHLTDRIHAENKLDVVRTSIDPDIQYDVNFFIRQHTAYLNQYGIKNSCALVVENKTGHIVAYVGSQDYEEETNGKVDGITAWRSSGSILKPFLYAAAIDDGIVLPQTLVKDVPSYFSSFSPSNASENFEGIVPASRALVHSLNVPAVRLLNAYGVTPFYNVLKAAGVSTLFRVPDDYGLSLILGGAEVTVWDVARLYRGLALGGRFGEISYQEGLESHPSPQHLISKGASFLIREDLKELLRPDTEFHWKKYGHQSPIAWKTGTSYGHKDAWAAGCTPKWTIVVWVGNFDGQSNKNLSGAGSAGPLLFSIFNTLKSDTAWFERDETELTNVNICKQTGFYASEFCTETVEADAPVGMKPIKTCRYHQTIEVDKHEQFAVCSRCWDSGHKSKSLLVYPPDVSFYLRKRGYLSEAIPPHNPACKLRIEREMLSIVYPVDGSNIFVPRDFDGDYEVVIGKVATQFPDRELFWHLDDEILGSSVNSPTFPLRLKDGKHHLTVTDTEGNRDKVSFTVITD